ncbi:MAG: cytochrome c oxidase subunit 3 [Bacteroidetes bacterium]|nr:cytochrome c oxidase subunit 3 [Bacteroidota bacterium]
MEIEFSPQELVNIAKAKRQLLYWSMASMVIFFAAFCSYYLVIHSSGGWLSFNLPSLFYVSTAVLIASSATMYWAQNAIKTNNVTGVKMGLLLTFLLGLVFCFTQIQAWKDLAAGGIFFAGKQSSLSGSILYVITFMHFMHLVAGLIALLFTQIANLRKKYSPEKHLGLTLCGIFWHFLDILWLILFLFLWFFR